MQHLDPTDLEKLRRLLDEEKKLIETELRRVGRVNPANPNDWEARPEEMDIQEADRNEAADRIEAYEENTAILKELETRWNNIKEAQARMDAGTYGTCAVGNEPIRKERLFANPAALTCVRHMDEAE
jgi:RNA polymerase-binding transcription factor DksA